MENDDNEAWDAEIRGRQRLFVLNYCTDSLCFLNGRRAYIEAYTRTHRDGTVERPTDEAADSCASRLLRDAKVRAAVRKLLLETQETADYENGHRLLRDLVLLATYNPADILDAGGGLKVASLEELGELAKCIAGIERTPLGVKVKLANREKATEKLLRYYGLTGGAARETLLVNPAGGGNEWQWDLPGTEEAEGWQE